MSDTVNCRLLTLFFNLVSLAYEYFGKYKKQKKKRLIATIFSWAQNAS